MTGLAGQLTELAGGAPHAPALSMASAASATVQSIALRPMAPPLIAALAGLAVLVLDLFLPAHRKGLLAAAAGAGLLAALLPLPSLAAQHGATFCLPASAQGHGHGRPPLCGYAADGFTVAVQLLVLGAAFLTVLLSCTAVRTQRLPPGEYWFLLLSATAGAALVPACRDLVSLVIALEVASLPAFALVGLRRGSRRSAEAALKFFLTSVTATAVTLLGAGFLYAATGTLELHGIAHGLAHTDPRLHRLATAALVLTFAGFAVKAAVVPFHFWVPDSYVGAPVPVAGFLSVVGKTAGLSGLILLAVYAFPTRSAVWGPLIAVLAAVTMTAGNTAALRQRARLPYGAVRLLSWSSVGQAGYLLVPLAAAADDAGHATGRALASVGATVAYLLMYAAVNLGAFAVVAHVASRGGGNRLTDYRGLYAEHPAAALALAFFLLCLAGLPPGFIGLFAKLAIFDTAVRHGLGWLAAVMAANVVVALYYYLRWTALLFQPAPLATGRLRTGTAHNGAPHGGTSHAGAGEDDGGAGERPAEAPGVRISRPLAAAIGLSAAAAVALSLDPDLVLTYTTGGLR